MRTITLLLFICMPFFAISQEIQMTQTFSSRLDNPVRITEIAENGSLVVMGENDSSFPYQVELKFNYVQNLSPVITSYKGVLMPGKKQLVKFRIISQNDSYNCPFSVRYLIGYAKANPDTSFLYSIPLTEGTLSSVESLSNKFYTKFFKLNEGDTVVAMRKGIVTSTASVRTPTEQLAKNSTVEILHDDNTVSIYRIDPQSKILVREGEKVYPLQPLAIASQKEKMSVSLYDITKEGRIISQDYQLENQIGQSAPNSQFRVKHLQDLVSKEMDKKEKKKLQKGTLYN
ncbi:MAG: hypothetical protein ACTHJN_18760 [Ginsengibacter sp.]